jgi:hypothetical protein
VSVCRSPRTGNAAEGEKVAAAEEREVTAANVAAMARREEQAVGAREAQARIGMGSIQTVQIHRSDSCGGGLQHCTQDHREDQGSMSSACRKSIVQEQPCTSDRQTPSIREGGAAVLVANPGLGAEALVLGVQERAMGEVEASAV